MLIVSKLELNLSKKLEHLSGTTAQRLIKLIPTLGLALIVTPALWGQNEELKQITEAFKKEHSEQYDLKFLNISKPDLGIIDETFPSLKDKFMLKSKEKMENNLGHRGYQKFYFNVYGYASLKDRQYALKDWMEDFLEGQSIRPGRQMRSYDYASPTIILINDSSIITINYQCSDYTEDNFEYWQDELLKYYGHDNTMVIEVLCGGPLEWTKNAPDPRETRGLF